MSKFKNALLVIILSAAMWLLYTYAQLHFELQDVKLSVGIGYIVLFSAALLLPLPSACMMVIISSVIINFSNLLSGVFFSTIIIDIIMLLIFEWWINYTKKMPFTIKYFPAALVACAGGALIYFIIDLIIFGFNNAVIGLGFRSIEMFICVIISLPLLYLISSMNIGVRKYSPRYKL